MSQTVYTQLVYSNYETVSGARSAYASVEDEGLCNIRTGIVEQAIKDYIYAQERLASLDYKEDFTRIDDEYMSLMQKAEKMILTISEIEGFFRSNWFKVLTCGTVDTEIALDAVRERAKENGAYMPYETMKAMRNTIQDEKKRVLTEQTLKQKEQEAVDIDDLNKVMARLKRLDEVIGVMQNYRPKMRTARKIQNYYDDLELLLNEKRQLLAIYKKKKGMMKK